MKSQGIHFLILVLTTILFVIISGCNDKEINSRWKDRDIIVDGDDAEWGNYIQYYDEETRIIFCMFNDDNDLYIKLSSPNRTVQGQFIGLGLTVWFDPKGGNKKKFGLHFPLGMQRGTLDMMRGEEKSGLEREADQIQKRLEMAQQEIELIGPGKNERFTLSVADAVQLGIQVKMGKPKGSIIYELKVPLAFSDNHPYAVGTTTDQKIGVGFETGKMNKEMMDEHRKIMGGGMGGRDSGGMIGGGISGRSGGMGGRSGGGGREGGGREGVGRGGMMTEPLELWTKIALASGPDTQ